LADVRALNLQDEDVFDKGSPSVRAANLRDNGATEQEIEFLLDQRVELNAMTSDQLVAWIEGKFAQYGVRKIIPDEDILARAYRAKIRDREITKAIAKIVEQEFRTEIPDQLTEMVAAFLREHPTASWDDAVAAAVDL